LPRRPIDAYWSERIRAIAANAPKLGPGPIARTLREDAKAVGRGDAPAERTVSRVLKTFRALPSEDQAPYREFLWPVSMERGDLPWEASKSVFELLRFLNVDIEGFPGRRPLVGHVRWFWRVTQAVPTADVRTRWMWASVLAFRDRGVNVHLPVLEWGMASDRTEPVPGIWFAEHVAAQAMIEVIDASLPPEVALEGLTGLPMSRDDALTFLSRLVQQSEEAKATQEVPTWQSEQTEKAASTGAPTGAGAAPSRSRKGSARTSSRRTAKKSRGS
jgi:hypothetical protein